MNDRGSNSSVTCIIIYYNFFFFLFQARIASQLNLRNYVRADCIAVLSLYPAQTLLIEEILQQKNQHDISVLPVSQARGKSN